MQMELMFFFYQTPEALKAHYSAWCTSQVATRAIANYEVDIQAMQEHLQSPGREPVNKSIPPNIPAPAEVVESNDNSFMFAPFDLGSPYSSSSPQSAATTAAYQTAASVQSPSHTPLLLPAPHPQSSVFSNMPPHLPSQQQQMYYSMPAPPPPPLQKHFFHSMPPPPLPQQQMYYNMSQLVFNNMSPLPPPQPVRYDVPHQIPPPKKPRLLSAAPNPFTAPTSPLVSASPQAGVASNMNTP
ncbi:hypothetical protein BJV82DRAFT_595316 [Fennellomyces sp. T-0311]|nr:hypothetical protein BJV82DRAFT_595316 [Fennellomyces sp. T-0311]